MTKATTKETPKVLNKSEIVKAIADAIGADKKTVNAVFEELNGLAVQALGKGGAGVFKIHGLVQLKRVDVPAKLARRGLDPFTKVERDFPAKPATSKIKAIALKVAKDAAAQ